jgi:hypothetical protein
MTNIKFIKNIFKVPILVLLGFLVTLIFFGVVVIVLDWADMGFTPYYFSIDSCFDYGGRWNYEINECEGSQSYIDGKSELFGRS